jgi:diguanylate cyclase (GGDEF)-like protein
MASTRSRSWWYALGGAVLSAGAPTGLLLLRELAGPRPVVQELAADWMTYVYVFLATAIVLTTVGFMLGRQADRLERLSVTDPLTGLLNRRAFRGRLTQELHRSMRYGSPLSLMLVDIDGLKELNDSAGHATGDRAICSVAGAINGTLRGSDFGARWGGDEFAIVAPNTAPAAAHRSAERLLAQVRQPSVQNVVPLNVSIGIATFDPARYETADIDALVHAADDALYMAKAAGGRGVRAVEQLARAERAKDGGSVNSD